MKIIRKITILAVLIVIIILIFSQTAVGEDFLDNLLGVGFSPKACDYAEGMIILVKPVATGTGDGRFEAGDIVEIRDAGKICAEYGDKIIVSKKEKTRLLPLYYPHKLTPEQIAEMTASEIEEVEELSPDGKETINIERIVKVRTKGVDYTAVLNENEIDKVSNFEDIKRLPQIELNIIREKTEEEKAVVAIADYQPKDKTLWQKFVDVMRPTAYALSETIIDVDTGGTGSYATLNAAIAAEQDDLTISDVQLTFTCRASDDSADEAAVNVDGYTVDSTRYIKIWTDPSGSDRHEGVWDIGKYRLYLTPTSNGEYMFYIKESYTIIDGLQIYENIGSYYGSCVRMDYPAINIIFKNNIVHGEGTNAYRGIYGPDYGKASIYNNTIYNFQGGGSAGSGISVATDNATNYNYYYNNTIFGCRNGVYDAGNNNSVLKNNISMNNISVDYSAVTFGTADKNVSSDASAPGTTVATGKTSYGDYFTDYTIYDFHLKGTGLSLFGISGDDLSGTFTDDIDGDTRSTWDVGADEYVAAGGEEGSSATSSVKVKGETNVRGGV
ncbi:MAG: hypothetical protein JW740_03205, partial [Candidatus Zambryskibacteria bacterium]|nr:hypothetical protein [Candidatus Zambryskibacteria bacterium]